MAQVAYLLIIIVIIVVTLIYGQSILMPFILGLLFWFVVRKVKLSFNKIPFFKNKFPSWAKAILAYLVIILVFGFVGNVLSVSISNLATSYEKYSPNIAILINQINDIFNINLIKFLSENSDNFNYGSLLSSIFNSISYILGNAFMIILYSLFILFEEVFFIDKLKMVFKSPQQFAAFSLILEKIEQSISSYFGLKTLISLLTGFLSFMVLWLIGIDSPIFWAFLIFLLNYIPTIGSLIATVFPAIFCLLQFGEFLPGVIVLLVVGAIQVVIGNIVEPKLMGSNMNISSLVTIIALAFWGALWGVTGMILSIPITVTMLIIFAQFKKTKPISIMLSENGIID